MDYQNAKLLFDIVQTILIAAIGIMNWLDKRQRVTVATIERLENNIDERLDSQGTRLTRVEQDMKNAPGHADFKRVYQRLDLVNGEMKEMKGELHIMKGTLQLIHEHLMNRK